MRRSPRNRPPIATLLRAIYPRLQLLDATLGGFVGLIAAAMYFYPGGTWWDRAARGHRFWENFLCDLLHARALGGAPNLVSARLAQLAVLMLIGATACALSLAPELIPSRRELGKRVARVGVTSTLLLVAVPLLPSDRFPGLHSAATVLGTLPALGAFGVLVGAMLLEPKCPAALRGTSLLLLVSLVLCLALYTWDVYLGGPSLKLLPGLERVATLVALAWLFIASRLVRQRLLNALLTAQKAARRTSEPQGITAAR